MPELDGEPDADNEDDEDTEDSLRLVRYDRDKHPSVCRVHLQESKQP